MVNLLYNLPSNCIEKIYSYDLTYHTLFNFCLVEMMLNFQETACMNKLLRKAYYRRRIFHEFVDWRLNNI